MAEDNEEEMKGSGDPDEVKGQDGDRAVDGGQVEEELLPGSSSEDVEEYKEVSSDGWEDVLGSGRLRKRILVEGHRGARPNGRPSRGDVAIVSWKGYFQEELFEERSEVEMLVGEAEVLQGIDLIVGLMDTGERCEVMADPDFAYGSEGLEPQVPPNAAVRFEIELLSHSPAPLVADLSIEDKFRVGKRKKDAGNFWFARQQWTMSVQCYRKAGEYFDDESLDLEVPMDRYALPKEVQDLLEERLKSFNNLAMAQMKLEAWDAALASLKQVLKFEPNNEKALYRKSKVLVEKCQSEEAIGILRRVNRLYPNNKLCQADLTRLTSHLRKDRLKEEALSKKMLGLDKYEAEKQAAAKKNKWWFMKLAGFLSFSGLVGLVASAFTLPFQSFFAKSREELVDETESNS